MTDIAHRASTPSKHAIASIGMFAVLALSLPINWSFLTAEAEHPPADHTFADRWFRGQGTAAITKLYNENFALKDVGIDLFGTLSYALFREGREGVLVGTDGWLFTREEFETTANAPAELASNLDRVAAAKQVLAERGIALVTAIVPSKVRMEPEHLGSLTWPSEPASRYDRILQGLAGRNVTAVDLRPALASAKADGDVFLHTDTHWTPLGASAAARAIASTVATLPDTGEPTAFRRVTGQPFTHEGDLMRYIRLGVFSGLLRPNPDRVTPIEADGEAAGGLLGDAAIPVALIGTSYSAETRWGFEAGLKIALQRDVMNLANEGQGPFEPMAAALDGDALRINPPRVMVWELPERYLDDPAQSTPAAPKASSP